MAKASAAGKVQESSGNTARNNWVYVDVHRFDDGVLSFQTAIVVAPTEERAYQIGAATIDTRQANGEHPPQHMEASFAGDYVVKL